MWQPYEYNSPSTLLTASEVTYVAHRGESHSSTDVSTDKGWVALDSRRKLTDGSETAIGTGVNKSECKDEGEGEGEGEREGERERERERWKEKRRG